MDGPATAFRAYAGAMTDDTRALLADVLALPDGERADLAAELLASLETTPAEDVTAAHAAWSEELERRARRVLAGESAPEAWDVVRDRVARELSRD